MSSANKKEVAMLKIKVTKVGKYFEAIVVDLDTDCGIWWGHFTELPAARQAAMAWIIGMFGEGQRKYVK